jgi:hypothetical protein
MGYSSLASDAPPLGMRADGQLATSSGCRTGRVIAAVSREVVLADTIFTASAVVLQPATGLAMVTMAGFPLSAPTLFGRAFSPTRLEAVRAA